MGSGFTRILFATDVHGSDPVWKKFIRGAERYKANVLIIGGDVTGKNVVAVTENPDGTYSAEFQEQNHSQPTLNSSLFCTTPPIFRAHERVTLAQGCSPGFLDQALDQHPQGTGQGPLSF